MVLRVLFVSSCIQNSLSADLLLVPCLALQVEKQKLSKGIEEMKTLVRNSHNKAKEVITRAEEELAIPWHSFFMASTFFKASWAAASLSFSASTTRARRAFSSF